MFSFLVRIPRFIVVTLTELMWALTGLLLTIGGNFVQASFLGIGWGQVPTHLLGVSYQIGSVLLLSCLSGRNAAVMAQIAYIALGLAGFQIFSQGGGIGYLRELSFGYLLGFIPAAWVCGYFAFRALPKLEWLALCCLSGLLSIHVTGLVYLSLLYGMHLAPALSPSWQQAIALYSGHPLPGQLAVVCAVTVIAFLVRRILVY
jgi:biotin transport system substrate-specific component